MPAHYAASESRFSSGFRISLEGILGTKLLEGFLETGNHALLTLSEPGARIVVLLVRSVFAFRIAQLTLKVSFLGLVVLEHAVPGSPLSIGVDVHLNYTVAYGIADILSGRAGTAVEYEA